METFLFIFVFIFGAIIGSFLNVVIYRYNTSKSISKGRSVCFSCHKSLSWFELIPIISFFIQRGKCLGCHSKISWQYPLIEALTGFVFILIALKNLSLGANLYYIIIFSLLIVILGYDFRHKIIPDNLVYTFALLSLGHLLFFQNFQSIDLLAGPILATPFAFLWFVSKGQWMGFGDAKLALGIGWFLGLSLGFSAIILAFWLGAFVGLSLILLSKLTKILPIKNRISMKTALPFAPFLIIGVLVIFVYEITFWDLSNFLTLV